MGSANRPRVPWLVEYDWREMTFRPYCQVCAWIGDTTTDNQVAQRALENHLRGDEHNGRD